MITKKGQVYARALFECNGLEETFKILSQMSDLFTEKKVLSFFLSLVVPKEEKNKLMKKLVKDLPSFLQNFFLVLLENKSLSLLPEIVFAYRRLLDRQSQLCRGEVFSAEPISKEQKEKLEALLEKFFNKKLQLSYKEDKSLKAGLYIKAGEYVFNSTMKHQLKNFQLKGV